MRTHHLAVAVSLLVLVSAAPAFANCLEDAREVRLAQDSVARMRAYLCRLDDGAQVRIEFHRLSDTAASMIVGRRNSALLRRTIGAPAVIENDVFRTYAELLRAHGVTTKVSKTGDEFTMMRLRIEAPGALPAQEGEDELQGTTLRTLLGPIDARGGDYPAIDEFLALRAKTIPHNLYFFYDLYCTDANAGFDNPTCTKYEVSTAQVHFWRPLTLDDVSNYTANARRFNAALRRDPSKKVSDLVPAELRFVQYLANGNLPDDFIILVGTYEDGGCDSGDGTPIAGWFFRYEPREVLMDAVVITNLSQQPVRLGGLLGFKTSAAGLRPAGGVVAAPSAAGTAEEMSVALAPNQSVLVPTRITFAPNQLVKESFGYRQTANALFRQRGIRGYTGNTTAHAAPAFRNYLYGPDILPTGIIIDGKRVDFASRSANFVDITISSESGSCPYLLSHDEEGWLDHGKILHRARTKARETTHAVSFLGFVGRFRLEERERESAYIDKAELVAVLKDGSTVRLTPDDASLADADGDYLQIHWGEALDFSFAPAAAIALGDVVETRLLVTGYYDRYADLIAALPEPGVAAPTVMLDRRPVEPAGR